MTNKEYISTTEAAKILNISRVAVFNRIKKRQIIAKKVGRNYIIDKNEIAGCLNETLSDEEKKILNKAIKKTIDEYGETLKLLGNA